MFEKRESLCAKILAFFVLVVYLGILNNFDKSTNSHSQLHLLAVYKIGGYYDLLFDYRALSAIKNDRLLDDHTPFRFNSE